MQNKVQYVLSLFRKVYRLEHLELDIGYCNEGSSRIRITPGTISPLIKNSPFTPDADTILLKSWKGVWIPFLFNDAEAEFFTREGNQWIIHVDLIGSAFFLLSGWEEYHSDIRDEFGRVPYSGSVQHRLGIVGLPVVNYYFDILKTVVEEAYQLSIKPFSWGTHPYSVFLSHDIDTCESAWLQGGFHLLKKGNIRMALQLLWKRLKGRDAWFNFEEILAIEKKFNAHSTFFFLALNKTQSGIKNADYNIARPKFKSVFDSILKEGSEVGVHGSIGTHLDEDRLQEEIELLKLSVPANRFHFLLFDPVKTPGVLDASAVFYDSSLGFAEQSGFRNSFCFPYQPYDIASDRPFGFYEIPLMVMDGTLESYLGLSPEEGFQQANQIINEVKKFGGCFSLLWHNTHFSDFKYSGWREVYQRILASCASDDAFLAHGTSIMVNILEDRFKKGIG